MARMQYEFISTSPLDFESELELQPLGSVALVDVKRTGQIVTTLTAAQARNAPARLNIQLCRRGRLAAEQGGRYHEAGPGDAVLVRADLPGSVESGAASSLHSIFIDNDRLLPFLPAGLPAACQFLPGREPALKLLSAWLVALSGANVAMDSDLKAIIEGNIVDLVVLALNPRDDARESAEQRTGRQARLVAILDQIAWRSREHLTAELVGASIGISERYVRQLLEETGKTFSERLLERRLEDAFKMLSDPRHSHRKVIDVAMGCGFSNVSHFSRSFRQRFEASPSEVRNRRR